MPVHITLISYQQKMETFLEGVALTVRPREGHNVRRIQEVADLYGIVEQAGGQRALRLDLVGHGKPSRFRLGDEILLESGKEPPEEFKRLAGLLPTEAEVRLLGCYTGAQGEGWEMLRAASAALGGRKVIGTTEPVEPYHFDENGLSGDCDFLVASNEPRAERHPRSKRLQGMDAVPEAPGEWQRLLPKGYQFLGRGTPLAEKDTRFSHGNATITIACDGLLVLIEDQPRSPPLVLQWSSPVAPPRLEDLRSAFRG